MAQKSTHKMREDEEVHVSDTQVNAGIAYLESLTDYREYLRPFENRHLEFYSESEAGAHPSVMGSFLLIAFVTAIVLLTVAVLDKVTL